MERMLCFCGHDCGRCLVRLATVTKDAAKAAAYREEARSFYRDTLHTGIPPDKLVCHGGRSGNVMEPCRKCPFRKCCKDRNIENCRDCPSYPCPAIAAYEKTWVNAVLQTPEQP